ncbi:GTP pyrophosphokinase [Spirulina sp. CCNP1310]|uniref:GTP pyrophosphokinase n=1 Tax=Spirulina sp. CCNP1310 TaxID=3110249 RepID=UPI002B21B81D|nr:GTP pyrophosphokinase [Spirulina sp. CCNP1310]MEA5418722.1 GTP pyrophosphokinase [Spirulina sp. CCNP1310]
MAEQALLNVAIALAHQAHQGQMDKGGHPYIGHPLRVMAAMGDEEAKIVAVLHDAIEDSDLSLADLTAAGFPAVITQALDALTKRAGEAYEDYLQRVMANPLALRVKIADMEDNCDLSRIAQPTAKDYARLAKYQGILPRLKAALGPLG